MSQPLDLFLIAGEPSGDRLGADLMAGLTAETGGAVRFHGLGGPLMEAQGMRSLFPIDELSIMGLAEVVPKIPRLLRRIRETADAVLSAGPAALITIDSPDFSLRVARRVRRVAPGVRTVHYVAPSVWAWRPGRAAKMARSVDHVLALLPFEPPYMTAAGMTCDFVGHPVAHMPRPEAAAVVAVRDRFGGRILTVLPGSRGGEVARHGPLFARVVGRLLENEPDLSVVIPTLQTRADQVRAVFAGLPVQIVCPDPKEKQAIFAASETALAVSGTVSVELAAAGTPMVVAYQANALSTFLAKRLVRTRYASLVNILLDRPVIPEFLAETATEAALTGAVSGLVADPAAKAAQKAAFGEAMEMLGRGGPATGVLAARSVLNAIG